MRISVNGHAVFAATGGRDFDADLPSVAFIHGAGLDHSVWSLQARYLAHHGHSVLAFDLPGHGRSAGRPLDTIAAMADWVFAALDAARVSRAALVGHSLGALVAIEAAARAGGRVTAIALLGAAERMPVHPDLLAAARANDHAAIDMITAWGHGGDAKIGGHPAPGLWMVAGSRRLLERSPPGVLHADLKACDDYGSTIEPARRLKCPALLIVGAADRMTTAKSARTLEAAIGGARTVVLARCGHMLMTERPDAVTDALAAFLDNRDDRDGRA